MSLLDLLIIISVIFGATGIVLFVDDGGRAGWYVIYCWITGSIVGGLWGLNGFLIVLVGFFCLAILFSERLNLKNWLNTSKENLHKKNPRE